MKKPKLNMTTTFLRGGRIRAMSRFVFMSFFLMSVAEVCADTEKPDCLGIAYISGTSVTFTVGIPVEEGGFILPEVCKQKMTIKLDGESIPFEMIKTPPNGYCLEAPVTGLKEGFHRVVVDNGEHDPSFRETNERLVYVDTHPPALEIVTPGQHIISPHQKAFVVRIQEEGSGLSEDLSVIIPEVSPDLKTSAIWVQSGATTSYLVLTSGEKAWDESRTLDFSVKVQDRSGNVSELQRSFEVASTSSHAWNEPYLEKNQCKGIVQTAWPVRLTSSGGSLVFQPDARTLALEYRLEGMDGCSREIIGAALNALQITEPHPPLQMERRVCVKNKSVHFHFRQKDAVSFQDALQLVKTSLPTQVYLESEDCSLYYSKPDSRLLQVKTESCTIPALLYIRQPEWADGVRTDRGVFRYVFFPGVPEMFDSAASWVELDEEKHWLRETLDGRYEVVAPVDEGIHNYDAKLHMKGVSFGPGQDRFVSMSNPRQIRRSGAVLIRQSPPEITSFRYEPELQRFTARIRDEGTAPKDLAITLRVNGGNDLVPEYDPKTFVMHEPYSNNSGNIVAKLSVTDRSGQRSMSACTYPCTEKTKLPIPVSSPVNSETQNAFENTPRISQVNESNRDKITEKLGGGFDSYEKGVEYINQKKHSHAVVCFNHCINSGYVKPEVYRKRGVAYLKMNKIYEAIHDFSITLDMDPNDAKAYSDLATAYSLIGDLEKSIEYADEAIRLDPDDSAHYLNRGSAYKMKKLFDESLSDFNVACSLNPDDYKTYANRASLLSDMKKYDESLKDYENALRIAPDNEKIFNNRAITWLKMKNFDNAIKDIEKSLEIDSMQPMAHFTYGNILGDMERYDEAVLRYKKSIELDPDVACVRFSLGKTYEQMGKPSDAIFQYLQCVKINPKHSDAYNNLGCAYLALEKNDLAIEMLNQAIEIKGDFAWAYNNRGLGWLNKKEKEEAINDFTTALKYMKFPAAYLNRANAYKQNKQYNKAIDDYMALIAIYPLDSDLLYKVGNLQIRIGEYKNAINNLSKSLEINPSNKDAMFYLGKAFMCDKKFKSGLVVLDKLIETNPDMCLAYLMRSYCWEELGDFTKALKDARTAFRINPYAPMVKGRVKKLEGQDRAK